MYQITVSPDTFNVLPTLVGQNPFIDASHKVNKSKAFKEHTNLQKVLPKMFIFRSKRMKVYLTWCLLLMEDFLFPDP